MAKAFFEMIQEVTPGTTVELRVSRPGNPQPLTFKLVRRQLNLPPSGKKAQR